MPRRRCRASRAGAAATAAEWVSRDGGGWTMAEKKPKKEEAPPAEGAPSSSSTSASGGTATATPKRSKKTAPKRNGPQMLPPWKVLLHNDDKNDMPYVVTTIRE